MHLVGDESHGKEERREGFLSLRCPAARPIHDLGRCLAQPSLQFRSLPAVFCCVTPKRSPGQTGKPAVPQTLASTYTGPRPPDPCAHIRPHDDQGNLRQAHELAKTLPDPGFQTNRQHTANSHASQRCFVLSTLLTLPLPCRSPASCSSTKLLAINTFVPTHSGPARKHFPGACLSTPHHGRRASSSSNIQQVVVSAARPPLHHCDPECRIRSLPLAFRNRLRPSVRYFALAS
jgi:hypothetical protein